MHPSLLSLLYEFCQTETESASEGDSKRQEEGGRSQGKERKEKGNEKESKGCREPSCAKYLTLCADLPKVRFVLGAYGFSHAGVLLSALPAEGILIKKGALLPPFHPSTSLPFSKAQVPPPSTSLPLPCPPPSLLEQECITAGQRRKGERETLEKKERKAGESG